MAGLERRHMSFSPDKYCWRPGQGVWKSRQGLPGCYCVVSCGKVFDSIQCTRKLYEKFIKRNFRGNLKIDQVKRVVCQTLPELV
jgi:hypothetical protein